ncbi:MAG: hypothetical protein HZA36_00560 [Parcubacteria group bacterium]|nr:hypothetical protein [Parcubacteria group bacterium]
MVMLYTTTHAAGIFDNPDVDPLQGKDLPDIINNINTFIRDLGLALVVIFIIYGGIQLMTSGGTPAKIQAGQNTLLYSAIGLGVILLAQGLIYAVLETLKVKPENMPNLTQQDQNTNDDIKGNFDDTQSVVTDNPDDTKQENAIQTVDDEASAAFARSGGTGTGTPIVGTTDTQQLTESMNCDTAKTSARLDTLFTKCLKEYGTGLKIASKATSLIGTETQAVSSLGETGAAPGVRCALFTGIAVNSVVPGAKLTQLAPENWANLAGKRYVP